MKEHYVYKYQKPGGRIVYIGKTNSSLKARIDAHKTEPQFALHIDDCEVYCAKLTNDVEVNSVEALLIQKCAPELNQVFFRCDQGSSTIDNLDWIPYSEYLASKKTDPQRLGVLKREAQQNEAFIYAVARALSENKHSFIFKNAHPSGKISFPWGEETLTHPYITKTSVGYEHLLTPAAHYALECKDLAVYEAWLPYIEGLTLHPSIEKQLSVFDALFDFAETLKAFKDSGFENERTGEKYIIRLPNEPTVQIYYASLFSNVMRYSEFIVAEIDPDAYKAIPAIESQIAADKLSMLRKVGAL